METTARRLAGATITSEDDGEVSARQLLLERDLVVRALSPLLAQRDLLRLARTNRACLREGRAGLETLSLRSLNVMYHDEVTGVLRLFPSLRSLDLEHLAIRSPITDLALVPLTQQCTKLRSLSVHSPHVTDQVISNLAGMVDLTLWHNQHVTLDALADLVRRSPDLFHIYIHASCSIDSHSLFWFLYEEMGPGVLRSHRALMRFLAVRIPKEDLLFPEAGLPEGIYQRIV